MLWVWRARDQKAEARHRELMRALDRFATAAAHIPVAATGAPPMSTVAPPSSRPAPVGLSAEKRATLVRMVRPNGPRLADEVLRKIGYKRTVSDTPMPPEWPVIVIGDTVVHDRDVTERALMVMAATLLAKQTGGEPTPEDIEALVADLTRPVAVRVSK
jgi:hypothetical protein